MEITFWEKINSRWSGTYYIEPIVILISLISIMVGVRFFRKEKSYIAFILYSLGCFFLFIVTNLFVALYRYKASPPSLTKAIILQTLNIVFALGELSIFYFYYLKIIRSKYTHTIMKICLATFLIFVIFSLIKINDKNFDVFDINQFSALISTIQFLLLLLPVFLYFLELIKNEYLKEINQSPSIWINCGLFVYILVTLPFLIISESLDKHLYNLMYALHYLSLNILFLTIIKAFLCRKPLTT